MRGVVYKTTTTTTCVCGASGEKRGPRLWILCSGGPAEDVVVVPTYNILFALKNVSNGRIVPPYGAASCVS
jgi:hypothetical protein